MNTVQADRTLLEQLALLEDLTAVVCRYLTECKIYFDEDHKQTLYACEQFFLLATVYIRPEPSLSAKGSFMSTLSNRPVVYTL